MPRESRGQQPTPPDSPRAEAWVGLSAVASGPTAALESSYSPPLLFDGAFASHAEQNLEPHTAGFNTGVTAGLNVFATPRVGFQVLFDRTPSRLAAPAAPYVVTLQYVSRPPPNGDPVPVAIDQSRAWPPAAGTLTSTIVGFNGIVRIGEAQHVHATLSAGPVYYRVAGNVEPIGYTSFRLGGHSVLFQDDYRLRASVGPARTIGVNIDGTVNVPAGPHTALMFGYRYIRSRTHDVSVEPAAILNPADIGSAQPLTDIARALALQPMRLSASSSRLVIGIKIR